MLIYTIKVVIMIELFGPHCLVSADAESERFRISADATMSTFITRDLPTTHIDRDKFIPGNIIFSGFNALWTTDGNTTELIAGNSTSYGYMEGVGEEVIFGYIYSFVQLTPSLVIVSDYRAHCLRAVDRHTQQSQPFAGNCTNKGDIDGPDPMFNGPSGVICDNKDSEALIVADLFNFALKKVDITSSSVVTMVRTWNALRYPKCLAQEQATGNIYITIYFGISKYVYADGKVDIISGFLENQGFRDGPLRAAWYRDPEGILILDDEKLATFDRTNNRIRLVDLQADNVSSICSDYGHVDGDLDLCRMIFPRTGVVVDDKLYIGSENSIRVLAGEVSNQTAVRTTTKTLGIISTLLVTSPDHMTATKAIPSTSVSTSELMKTATTTPIAPSTATSSRTEVTITNRQSSSDENIMEMTAVTTSTSISINTTNFTTILAQETTVVPSTETPTLTLTLSKTVTKATNLATTLGSSSSTRTAMTASLPSKSIEMAESTRVTTPTLKTVARANRTTQSPTTDSSTDTNDASTTDITTSRTYISTASIQKLKTSPVTNTPSTTTLITNAKTESATAQTTSTSALSTVTIQQTFASLLTTDNGQPQSSTTSKKHEQGTLRTTTNIGGLVIGLILLVLVIGAIAPACCYIRKRWQRLSGPVAVRFRSEGADEAQIDMAEFSSSEYRYKSEQTSQAGSGDYSRL